LATLVKEENEKKWEKGAQYLSKIHCINTIKSRFKEEGE
jgi:hypothetical protein